MPEQVRRRGALTNYSTGESRMTILFVCEILMGDRIGVSVCVYLCVCLCLCVCVYRR